MPHKVERWQCDFCKQRTLKSRKLIEQHENNCFDNPARRACRTCAFEDFDSYENGQFRLCLNEHDYLEDPAPLNLNGLPFDPDPGIRWNCAGWLNVTVEEVGE